MATPSAGGARSGTRFKLPPATSRPVTNEVLLSSSSKSTPDAVPASSSVRSGVVSSGTPGGVILGGLTAPTSSVSTPTPLRETVVPHQQSTTPSKGLSGSPPLVPLVPSSPVTKRITTSIPPIPRISATGMNTASIPTTGPTMPSFMNSSTASVAVPEIGDKLGKVTDPRPTEPASGEEEPSSLLAGWERIHDPSTGDVYYSNADTGASTWDPPLANTTHASTRLSSGKPKETSSETTSITEISTQSVTEDIPPTTDVTASSLPPGWQTMVDPTSGNVYYFNESTNESSWDPPPPPPVESNHPTWSGINTAVATPSDIEPSNHVALDGKDENEPNVAKESGPVEVSPEPVTDTEQVLAPGWSKMIDPTSGDVYYYNNESGESTWDPPLVKPEKNFPSVSDGDVTLTKHSHVPDVASPETDEMGGLLVPGWQKVVDPSSGDVYYYNEETNESAWDPPLREAQPLTASMPEAAVVVASEDANLGHDTAEKEQKDQPLKSEESKVMDTLDATLASGWKKFIDPSSGDVYYFNEETGESSWEPPLAEPKSPSISASISDNITPNGDVEPATHEIPEEEINQEESPGAISPEDKSSVDMLAPGWRKLIDPSSGDAYYFNETTNESSWDPPAVTDLKQTGSNGDTTSKPDEEIKDHTPVAVSPAIEDSTNQVLAPGWEMIVDPTSGDVYYHNKETGASSWDPPVEEQEQHSPIVSGDNHDTPVEASGMDQNVSQRETPFETSPADNDTTDVLLPGWQKLVDPSSGDVYYYNETTQENSWDPPVAATSQQVREDDIAQEVDDLAGHTASVVQGSGDEPYNSKDESEIVQVGWKKMVHPTTGDVYLYNEETGETSWDTFVIERKQYSIPSLGNDIDHTEDINLSGKSLPEQVDDKVSSEESIETEALAPGWQKIADSSGDVYYFNKESGETSWDPPLAEPKQPVSAASSPDDDVIATEELDSPSHTEPVEGPHETDDRVALAPGWQKMVDPGSGDEYYYNEESGESSWDPPLAEPKIPPSDGDAGLSEGIDHSGRRVAEEDSNVEPSIEASPRANNASGVLAPGWKEVVDPSSGDVYYYNEETNETSWDPPFVEAKQSFTSEHEADMTVYGESESVGHGKHLDQFDADPSLEKSPKATDKDSDLVTGWQKVIHPSTGEVYYFNQQSGATSWDPPSAEPQLTTSPIYEAATPVQGETEATVHLVPKSEVTSDLQVEASQESSDNANDPSPVWKKVVDPSSGDSYYYNEETGESSWDPPYVEKQQQASVDQSDKVGTETDVLGQLMDDSEDKIPSLADDDVAPDCDTNLILAPGWQKIADSSGDVYYFNKESGDTSWDPPLAEPKQPVSAASSPDDDVIATEELDSPSHTEPVEGPHETDDRVALAPGWQKMVDPGSGDEYYYNEESGESSWDPPLAEPKIPPSDGDAGLSEGIDHSGRRVAEEDSNVETSIEASPRADNASGVLAPGWKEVVDPSSGDVYYYNEETNETSWDPPIASDVSDPKTGSNVESSNAAEPKLMSGWQKVIDPSSGDVYYYNETTAESTWDAPLEESVLSSGNSRPDSTQDGWQQVVVGSSGEITFVSDDGNSVRPRHETTEDESSAANMTTKNKEPKQSQVPTRGVRSLSSFALFAFGGRLCVAMPGRSRKIGIHRVGMLVPDNPVLLAETAKRQSGFSGPLILAEDSKVAAYVTKEQGEERNLLWSLIQIASNSRGRLRSDDRVNTSHGPEASIVELLLRDRYSDEQDSLLAESPLGYTGKKNDSCLESVQNLLLRGEREKAVEKAVESGQFALALLIASMCTRETYARTARKFAEQNLIPGTPLYTTSVLFSTLSEAPSTDESVIWGDDSNRIRKNWRKHLAAIVSNRTSGWDIVAMSLGDRLRSLGEIAPSHICYMVCGCALSSPLKKESKMTLLGCDVSSADAFLFTDLSVKSFCATEAFEWAKRRGNQYAVIQSLQTFKLQYAMLLCDLGLEEVAKCYIRSIRQCLGALDKVTEESKNDRHPFVALLVADRSSVLQRLAQFELRLGLATPAQATPCYADSSDDHSAPVDLSFKTAQSSLLDENLSGDPKKKLFQSEKKKQRPRETAPKISSTKEKLETSKSSSFGVKQNRHVEPKTSLTIQTKPTTNGTGVVRVATDSVPHLGSSGVEPNRVEENPHSAPLESPSCVPSQTTTDTITPRPSTEQSRVKKTQSAPKSAPANLQSSPSKRGFFSFGIKEKILKWANPDAHVVSDVGQTMQAYYDEKRKVWVFPGEDPDELAKPVGPPPIMLGTPMASSQPDSSKLATAKVDDPLAAMMAPPQRVPSALRNRTTMSSAVSPGLIGGMTAQPPPRFAVFQPKPQVTAEAAKEDECT